MIQNILKKLKRIFIKSTYSTSSGKILKKYGNQIITKVEIGKSLLPPNLRYYANLVTLGQFTKNLPFDIYHFFLKITLSSNTILIVEKNDIINITKCNVIDNTNYTNLILPNPITLKRLLTKTKKKMGNLYFSFDFHHNNCEFFIVNLLQVMKIEAPILNKNYSNIYNNIHIIKILLPYMLFIRQKIYYILNATL